MGFFKTLISICSGTALFPKLLEGSMLKALWHMLLLAFCGAVFTVAMRAVPIGANIQALKDSFGVSFGAIKASNEAILPVKNDGQAASALSPGFVRIDYFPSTEAIKAKEILDDKSTGRGFVWTPALVLSWTRVEVPETFFGPLEEKYALMPFAYKGKASQVTATVSTEDLEAKLKSLNSISAEGRGDNSPFLIYPFGIPLMKQAAINIWSMLLVGLLAAEGLMSFINIFSFSVFYASFTALICYGSWREINPAKKLTLGGIFSVGLYTGFPAVIIASCFPAFDLPFLDYRWAFTIAFLVYFFPVFNRIQTSLMPPPKKTAGRGSGGDDEDIFF